MCKSLNSHDICARFHCFLVSAIHHRLAHTFQVINTDDSDAERFVPVCSRKMVKQQPDNMPIYSTEGEILTATNGHL